MKFNANTKEIQAALKNLLKVSAAKSNIVCFNSVKVTVTEDQVILSATNINLTAAVTLKQAEAIEKGSSIISKETIKLISKLTDYEMTITDNEIHSGKRKVNYKRLDIESYLLDSNKEYNQSAFTIPAAKMKEIISITYACGTSESRPVLQGVCFRENNVIACDGHRLAMKTLDYNDYKQDMVIHYEAFNMIDCFIEKKFDGRFNFNVSSDNHTVKIDFDNVTFEIRQNEGTFPDVSRIIPHSFTTEVKVKKSDIIEELKVLKEVKQDDKLKLIKIEVSDKLKLIAEADSNSMESEVQSTITGDTIQLGCNAQYLIEAIETNNNDYVTIKFTGKTTAIMIDSDSLVMPYRVA